MKLRSTVGGVQFPELPIMVGAGACKTPESTFPWLDIIATVSGSYTPEGRRGTEGSRLDYPANIDAMLKQGGLNALGMPNMGYAKAIEAFDHAETAYPLIISVAGFHPDEFCYGVNLFSKNDSVAAIEVNLGCPNTEHSSIMSFSIEDIRYFFGGGFHQEAVMDKAVSIQQPGVAKRSRSIT